MIKLQLAAPTDAAQAMALIDQAKQFLKSQGVDQWQTGYPDLACIERDIAAKKGYFLTEDGEKLGYLCIDFDGEPAYLDLNGSWKSDLPYVVVHRMAISSSGRGKGYAGTAFALVEELARERSIRSIRVDTDADNQIMQHILAKCGFDYRGTICFDNSEKIAFEKLI